MTLRREVWCATLAGAVFAGAHGAIAQVVDRSKPPAAGEPAPFAFPKMETRQLSNGLRVVVIEDHALPIVAVRAVVAVDSLDDPVGKAGMYVLTAGMLREGTAKRSADELSASAAALGNAVFPFRFTTIAQNFEPSLELMADMLIRPTFPQTALDRLKVTLAASQQRQLQVPATVPNTIFLSHLFGSSHPVARSTSATEATMASITRDELVAFHAGYFRPNNTTIVVVGDVRPSDVSAVVARHFGEWQRGTIPTAPPLPAGSPRSTTIYLVDQPGVQQSYVFIGMLGPVRSSPDFAALEVMAPILGGSSGSRLYDNLRQRHSYMYSGTAATITWRREPIPSVIGGSAAVATTKTDSALIEWLGELRGMREREPSAREMDLARGALTGALPVQIETDDLIANRVVTMLQNDIPLDFYNSYGTRIASVTPAQVRAAAEKYIDPSHLVIVVAGDRKVVEPALRAANIAPIVVVDDARKP